MRNSISAETVARMVKRWNDNTDFTLADLARSMGMTLSVVRRLMGEAIARGEARPLTLFAKGRKKTQAERNWSMSMHGKRVGR